MTVSERLSRQMRIYTASLDILMYSGLWRIHAVQVDITIDNLYEAAQRLLIEARKELAAVKKSVKVKA